MARETTKRAMSEAAKEAKAKRQLASVGLGEKELTALKEKYGERAYDLVAAAMFPDNVRKALGEKVFKKSRATIKDFIEKGLTAEQIEKITGKKADKGNENPTPQKENKREKTKDELKKEADRARDEAEKKKEEERKRKEEEEKKRQAKKDKEGGAEPEQPKKKGGAEPEQPKKEGGAEPEQPKKKGGAEPEQPKKDKEGGAEPEQPKKEGGAGPEQPKKEGGAGPEQPKKTYTPTWQEGAQPQVIDEKTTLTPDSVSMNITKQGGGKSITFASSAKDDKGVTIPELAGATSDSIWGVTYKREVPSQENPVGCRSSDGKYWGAMQYNQLGLENIAIYALTHPEYKNIADKFFKPGYEQALKEFEADVAKRGKGIAYATGQAKRRALAKYLKPDYKTLFQKEGKENPEQFLQLQRDVSSDVTSSFYQDSYKALVNTLAKKGIKPEEVNPAIWGMVASIGIARGNIDGIANKFAGKDLSYINSTKMVEDLRVGYPSVFIKYLTGRQAAQYARDHVHEKHSATTSRELSMILNKPEIYEEYLKLVAENNVRGNNNQYIAKGKEQKPVTQTAWMQQGQNHTM